MCPRLPLLAVLFNQLLTPGLFSFSKSGVIKTVLGVADV